MRKITLLIPSLLILCRCAFAAPQYDIVGWSQYGSVIVNFGDGPVTQSDLIAFRRMLNITQEQDEILSAIIEEVLTEYDRQWLTYAERIADLEAAQGVSWNYDAGGAFGAEQAEQAAAERERFEAVYQDAQRRILEEIRLVLTPEQESRWIELERYRTRANTLASLSNLPAEKVDLYALALDIIGDQPINENVQAILDDYSSKIDSQLTRRNSAAAAAFKVNSEIDGRTSFAEGEYQKLRDQVTSEALKAYNASEQIATINTRTLATLAEALPQALSDELLERAAHLQATMRTFGNDGRVFFRSRNMIERAEFLNPTPEQSAQLKALLVEVAEAERTISEQLEANADRDESPVSFRVRIHEALQLTLRRSDPVEVDPGKVEQRAALAERAYRTDLDLVRRVREVLTVDQRLDIMK